MKVNRNNQQVIIESPLHRTTYDRAFDVPFSRKVAWSRTTYYKTASRFIHEPYTRGPGHLRYTLSFVNEQIAQAERRGESIVIDPSLSTAYPMKHLRFFRVSTTGAEFYTAECVQCGERSRTKRQGGGDHWQCVNGCGEAYVSIGVVDIADEKV